VHGHRDTSAEQPGGLGGLPAVQRKQRAVEPARDARRAGEQNGDIDRPEPPARPPGSLIRTGPSMITKAFSRYHDKKPS
jgi:hypothetical protein